MLLFISVELAARYIDLTFQNISCDCLSRIAKQKQELQKHFKTSHVIVYRWSRTAWRLSCVISKHLMLLFICLKSIGLFFFLHFKTSHVIVYHAIPYLEQYVDSHFKTSHVIVYLRDVQKISFQEDFKTSHVIVYHQGR